MSGRTEDPTPLTPLTMALLLALAEGDLHGYALLQEVEHQSEGALRPGTGTLYAALERLEDEGLIRRSPDLPAPGEDQRRRYFRITDDGRDAVRAESARMLRTLRAAAARDLVPGGLGNGLEEGS